MLPQLIRSLGHKKSICDRMRERAGGSAIMSFKMSIRKLSFFKTFSPRWSTVPKCLLPFGLEV